MIKALALRFRPASARSLIYLMSGIVVLLGGAALAFFYWQTSEIRKIETLANGYHLATLDACASIKEELFLLEKASDQKSSTQANGLVLPNQIHSSAHIIEKRTDHILLLQDTFRHPEFQATVRRLEARTRQLLRLVAAEEATEGIAPALLQREVASLQVVTGQLQRLHASSYKEAAAGLTTQQQLNTRNLFIFVGVLLAVGFLVIWRIVVVTAAKGSEEKEYGPTVVLAIFLAGGIFLLDLLAPLGVAGAVPYVALVLVSLSLPHRKHTLAAATFASVLTVLGFFLSPAGGTLWVVLANRGLALFAIWVTATLGLLHKQAEQALRFTQVAVDHYSDLALWMTPDARFFYVNDAACRILGYSREELTSMKVSDINLDIPEETWPKIWSKIKQSGGFTFEARVRTKGGRIFPAEVKTNYVVFQGKEYNCSLIRDITERKRAEEALRKSEVMLTRAQRIAQLGSWEWNLVTGEVYISEELCRIFGRTVEELSNTEVFFQNLHPEDRLLVATAMIDALEGRKPYKIEYRIIRRDGTVRTIYAQGEVSFDQEGKPLRMVGADIDITERKRAEQALRQSEASLADAQRIAHLGSWDWNTADGSVVASEELYRIFGFDPEKTPFTYDLFLNSLHPEDRPAVEQALSDALQGKKPYNNEFRIRRPDGSVRNVHARGELIRGQEQQPLRMVGTAQDITERKRAEQALRQQAQVIDQIHDSVVSTDLDDYITSWNKGAEKLYGYRAEEVLGKHISLVYLDRDRQLSQKQLIDPLLELEEGGVGSPKAPKVRGTLRYPPLAFPAPRR